MDFSVRKKIIERIFYNNFIIQSRVFLIKILSLNNSSIYHPLTEINQIIEVVICGAVISKYFYSSLPFSFVPCFCMRKELSLSKYYTYII